MYSRGMLETGAVVILIPGRTELLIGNATASNSGLSFKLK